MNGASTSLVVMATLLVALVIAWAAQGWRARRARTATGVAPAERVRAQRLARARAARARAAATLAALRERADLGRWTRRHRALHHLPWIAVLGDAASDPDALVRHALTGAAAVGRTPGHAFDREDRPAGDRRASLDTADVARWRVGDHAVWIDWPASASSGAHEGLEQGVLEDLARWRRCRPRHPLDVILLAVDAGSLCEGTTPSLLLSAAALGARLRLLAQRLGVRCPVQVVVTHCDRLPGFDACFADIAREDRRATWGVSWLPAAAPAPARASTGSGRGHDVQVDPATPARLVRAAVDDLVARLQMRRLDRLAAERQLARRESLVAFPAQVAALRHALPAWLEAVIDAAAPGGPSRAGDSPWLAAVALVSTGNAHAPACFVDDLLRREVPGLAPNARPTARAHRRRRAWAWTGALALCGVLATLGVSRAHRIAAHERALQEVAQEVNAWAGLVGALPTGRLDEPEVAWPALGAAERLQARLAEPRIQPHIGAPWRDVGLAPWPDLRRAVDDAVTRAVQRALWPRVLARAERRTREASDLPARYEALHIERLLREPARGQPGVLGAWWRTSATDPADDIGRATAARDAERIVHFWRAHPPAGLPDEDAAATAAARADVARLALPERVLARLRAVPDDASGFRPDVAAGPRGALLFGRASGAPWSQALPARAVPSWTLERIASVVRDVTAEATWVLGDAGASGPMAAASPDEVAREVRRRQADEAIAAWDAWFADLQWVDDGGVAGALQALRVIADEPSPLRQLATAIAQATQPRASVPIAQKASPDAPSDALAVHFEPLRRMLAGNDRAPSPLDTVLAGLRELGVQLAAAEQASRQGLAPPPETPAIARLRTDIEALPVPWRPLLSDLVARATRRVGAAGARQLGAAIAGGSGVLCRQALAGRFPVVAEAAAEVPPGDFVALFAPDGLFDREVRTRLSALVDTTVSPWRARVGVPGADQLAPATVASLQRAAAIREAFFSPSGAPEGGASATGELVLKSLDEGVAEARVILDGVPHVMTPVRDATLHLAWRARSQGGRMQLVLLHARGVVAASGGAPASGTDDRGATFTGPVFEGAWALFRWIDAGLPRALAPERLALHYGPPGRGAVFELRADSVRNPWRLGGLRDFRCPA